jgi:co-chaperonin GroES (HSP10)
MVKARNEYVIAKEIAQENKTASGILLTADKDTHITAKVLSVGNTVTGINENDIVIFMKQKGIPLTINNVKLFAIQNEDIIAIIDERN